jgi:hypothetical protein
MDPYQTLSEYDEIKTFKINDAYEVIVYDREPSIDKLKDYEMFTDEDIKLYGINEDKNNRIFPFKNCIKFTPPVYAPKVELLEFCNTTREVYIPNSEAPKEVQLEFSETERMYIWKFIKYCLTKNFLEESMIYSRDHYNPYRYIDRIDISIYDNSLRTKTLTHRFKSCRISTYDYGMEFDYAGSELIKPRIGFNFLQYSIIYGDESKLGEELEYEPNYNVTHNDLLGKPEKLDLKLKGEFQPTKRLI